MLFALLLVPGIAANAAAPVRPLAAVEAYLEDQQNELRRRLQDYNQAKRLAKSPEGHWDIRTYHPKIDRLDGNKVFLIINYEVGRLGWQPTTAVQLFELEWRDGALAFLAHKAAPRGERRGGGWIGDATEKGCTPNYYAPRPCLDVVRRWTEFTTFNDLAMNPESAAIFQAYAQDDGIMGDRLLARSRGLPDPTGESVFQVQRQIDELNLRQYQRNPKNPCSLNPYGTKPCPEILQKFKSFARRHGLPADRTAGLMFESYAQGDYRKADVLYAYAKDLPVPAYGYTATGIGRDVALAGLRPPNEGEAGACTLNPYDPKPCPESVQAWRSFAARYDLQDNAANAKIFQSYAEGEQRTGDRLFAQAKGVALDELLKAAGVPSSGLVIEVYPGRKQKLDRVLTGT